MLIARLKLFMQSYHDITNVNVFRTVNVRIDCSVTAPPTCVPDARACGKGWDGLGGTGVCAVQCSVFPRNGGSGALDRRGWGMCGKEGISEVVLRAAFAWMMIFTVKVSYNVNSLMVVVGNNLMYLLCACGLW